MKSESEESIIKTSIAKGQIYIVKHILCSQAEKLIKLSIQSHNYYILLGLHFCPTRVVAGPVSANCAP